MKSCALFLLLVLAAILPLSAQDNQTQTPAASPQQTQTTETDYPAKDQQQKAKHPGGKDDVDAIGTRKIGGVDWYSWDKEIQLGNEYAQRLERSVKLVDDPVICEYVNRIGQNLVRNSDVKIPVIIKIVDSSEVNAFTLPGGHLYVDTGLLMAAEEEDELAGAMAHEIGHIAARHATRGATRAEIFNLLRIPAGILVPGGALGVLVGQGLAVGVPLTFLKFSRGFEAEADYLGIQYMYKAGYDPNAMITFFEKLEAMERRKPGTLNKLFSTHPQTPDRAEKSQHEIATILPDREQYIITTSEFDQVKARLASIQNGHQPQDLKDPSKPTLRRAPAATPSSDDKGDDRPVLKKRGE